MWTSIRKYTIDALSKCIGQRMAFKSDCEMFPHFYVEGKLIGLNYQHNEILMKVMTSSHKTITIGSNMKNLQLLQLDNL